MKSLCSITCSGSQGSEMRARTFRLSLSSFLLFSMFCPHLFLVQNGEVIC